MEIARLGQKGSITPRGPRGPSNNPCRAARLLQNISHTMSAAFPDDVREWRDRIRSDLWSRTLPFWLSHSVDAEHGGFFNCLDLNGAVYDTTKHVWLQGRQCWMLARIANEYSDGKLGALSRRHPP